MDLHHEPSPSHGEMQHSYTLGAPGNTECGARNAELNALGHSVWFALRAPRFAFELASVAGLAPARLGLKARLLDRLCIHGRIMAAGVGLAPTPPVLQTGVQTLYTIQRKTMVVPAGNAPASPAYRAGALLLSYGTKKGRPRCFGATWPPRLTQSRNATWLMVRDRVSVFISTRCHTGSVIVR